MPVIKRLVLTTTTTTTTMMMMMMMIGVGCTCRSHSLCFVCHILFPFRPFISIFDFFLIAIIFFSCHMLLPLSVIAFLFVSSFLFRFAVSPSFQYCNRLRYVFPSLHLLFLIHPFYFNFHRYFSFVLSFLSMCLSYLFCSTFYVLIFPVLCANIHHKTYLQHPLALGESTSQAVHGVRRSSCHIMLANLCQLALDAPMV